MSSDNCIFCKIVAGEIPCFKVYEDEHTLAFMDINPATRGHALVIPKEHSPNLFESPDAQLAAVAAAARKVGSAIQAALAPDGLNLVQANGPGAAQSVFHLHFHVLPRYTGDNLLLNWGMNPGNMDEIKAVSEQIARHVDA
ncbi:MAG: HIT family protein [Arenicellales bacterium]